MGQAHEESVQPESEQPTGRRSIVMRPAPSTVEAIAVEVLKGAAWGLGLYVAMRIAHWLVADDDTQ